MRLRPATWLAYMVLGGLLSTVYFFATSANLHHAIYIGVGLSSVIACSIGVRKWQPEQKTPWYLLAAGQLCFVTADSTRAFYESVIGVEAPFPGLADVFFVSGYPFLAAGLVMIIRRRDPSRERAEPHRRDDHLGRPRHRHLGLPDGPLRGGPQLPILEKASRSPIR